MSTPEQRFEVPPEYAEVYERAYRRAYEEGQGQLSGNVLTTPTPRRTSSRGKRVAVPQQRTSRKRVPEQRRAPSRASDRASDRASEPAAEQVADPAPGQVAGPVAAAPAATSTASRSHGPRPSRRSAPAPGQRAGGTGHRADPRAGSTVLPLVGLGGLMVLLLVGAFLLGRVTAGTVSTPHHPATGGEPGATASATEGPATTAP